MGWGNACSHAVACCGEPLPSTMQTAAQLFEAVGNEVANSTWEARLASPSPPLGAAGAGAGAGAGPAAAAPHAGGLATFSSVPMAGGPLKVWIN
jgi:hypothetical protein